MADLLARERWCAESRLVDLLIKQGRLDELQERADIGHRYTANQLADQLAKQGHIDKLRDRADRGDHEAAERLTRLLAEEGYLTELWNEVDASTPDAGKCLINLLERISETEQADLICSFGLNPDGSIAESGPP